MGQWVNVYTMIRVTVYAAVLCSQVCKIFAAELCSQNFVTVVSFMKL